MKSAKNRAIVHFTLASGYNPPFEAVMVFANFKKVLCNASSNYPGVMTMASMMKPSLADAIQMLGRTYRNRVQASFVLCMEGVDIVTSYRY